jgi:hypothetical protein
VGVVFDQVMRRMQAEFPNQQIGLGELGYWISGQQYWWAYNATNVTTAKDMVLGQYYNAVLGYAGANGACFWWNFSSTGSDPDFDNTMTNSINTLKMALSATGSATQPTPPGLGVARAGGAIDISWPVSAGFTLYSAPVGGSPQQWTLVPVSEYVTNGSTVYFPADPAGGNFLFRLYHP